MPSSSPRSTRRRLLRSAAALAGVGAVAGCNGTGEASNTAVSEQDPDPPADAVTDPAAVVLRAPSDEPVIRESTDDGDTASDDGSDGQVDEWRHDLIAEAETASSLSIADVDGADEAREFLEGTDFETETVYVERHVVGECYEQRLCWIRWTDERVETSYTRVLRPAEAACSADARVGVTHLIRLPVALDPERIRGFSSGGGSGQCRTPTGSEGSTGDGS